MNRLNAFSLLLAGALLVSATPALAEGEVFDNDLVDDTVSIASGNCDDGIAQVADLNAHAAEERIRNQHVDVDEDDVLLAIALRNNGAGDIGWDDISDVDLTKKMRVTARQDTDLDRETVFSALALGVDDAGGSLDALACVSDLERSATQIVRYTRDVDLSENNVLLAIALANGGGGTGDLDLGDVADIHERLFTEDSINQDVDIDREDAFLALALGAGGS